MGGLEITVRTGQMEHDVESSYAYLQKNLRLYDLLKITHRIARV